MIYLSIFSFADQVKAFAESTSLNTWDWLAFLIAIISLCVAGISLYIAFGTLKSQKKTEKNTQPVMTEKVQYLLLKQKTLALLDTYIFLFSLHYILNKYNYKVVPSNHFWQYVEFDTHDLNESLFYLYEDKFSEFHNLKKSYDLLRDDIASFKNILLTTNDKTRIEDELCHIYDNIGMLTGNLFNTLQISFGKDDEQIKQFFKDNFFCVFETQYYNRYIKKFCHDNNRLSLPYLENSESEQFLSKHVESFCELASEAIGFDDTEIGEEFRKYIILHSNVIVLNTQYNRKNISIAQTDKQPSPRNYSFSYNWAYEKNVDFDEFPELSDRILPKAPVSFNRWLFYVKDKK